MRHWWQRGARLWAGVAAMSALPGAQIDVDGLGWRTEMRLERTLREILFDAEEGGLDAVAVEDGLLILRNELRERGFLSPSLSYRLEKAGEETYEQEWDPRREIDPLPWDEVDRLHYRVDSGPRAFFKEVTFEGLVEIEESTARNYFFPTGSFFVSKRERAYSPGRLQSGMTSLRRRLEQFGYLDAVVEVIGSPKIEEGEATTVDLRIVPGPVHRWGEIALEWDPSSDEFARGLFPVAPVRVGTLNGEVLQDLQGMLRRRLLRAGYPDAVVQVELETPEVAPGADERVVDVRYRLAPGPRVRLAGVRFEGLEVTQERVVERVSADLAEDVWLDRLAVEETQFKLGRLGVFTRLQTDLEPPEGDARTVVFAAEERKQYVLTGLIGYGSYERLRVGLEGNANNLFGLAHAARLRLRQSLVSTGGQLVYQVPRPFLDFESGQMRLQGLQRKEISFTRQEALAAASLVRPLWDDAVQFSLEYRYELLRSRDVTSTEVVGETRATVGSVLLGLSWDDLDRVISPRNGGAARVQLELASPVLGSDAYFQRLQVRTSRHFSFDQERLRWHFGLEGGALSRVGAEATELPFNKRFFPGGENSLRGYKEGEASPLDRDGKAIGAELYALGHIEFEALLTQSLSGVIFLDGLWAAADLTAANEGEALFSLGVGLRYSTPLGPLRLEYGHNLNPREPDPVGSVHFSIGFPF